MNKIEFGDCRETMRRWKEQGVKAQMCVTSPPYFGLRSYGGGDAELGKEPTPAEYIANMVETFRCVWDVLADDGTLWLNIGDSYARDAAKGQHKPGSTGKNAKVYDSGGGRASATCDLAASGLKQKDLIGIPWMLAFALRADGWYLRQELIWHKPNPMPESVTDRCTKAHESIFLLAKQPKYFIDPEGLKEPANPANYRARAKVRDTPPGQTPQGKLDARRAEISCETRNKRSVWTVATKPYKGAHFAVFPEALIEPCVLAGSRVGDTVLDPFMGSGTTAGVALKNRRQYLGCELNPEYGPLQQERIAKNFIF